MQLISKLEIMLQPLLSVLPLLNIMKLSVNTHILLLADKTMTYGCLRITIVFEKLFRRIRDASGLFKLK